MDSLTLWTGTFLGNLGTVLDSFGTVLCSFETVLGNFRTGLCFGTLVLGFLYFVYHFDIFVQF